MHDPGSSLPRVLVVHEGDDAARRELTEAVALVGLPTSDLSEKFDALIYRLASPEVQPLRALLEAHHPAAVVLIDQPDRALIGVLTALPVHSILLAPHAPAQVAAALGVAVARQREAAHLAAEVERLQQSLSNRKLIERAKGALMKRYRWTEPEAFRRLQRAAMNQRVSMADLARQILDGRDVAL
jgi:AmiR/NasT family two-component response regulator